MSVNNINQLYDINISTLISKNKDQKKEVDFNEYTTSSPSNPQSLENRVKRYEDMIEFLVTTDQMKQDLEKKLNDLPRLKESVEEIYVALENQNWKSPCLGDDQLPYYALAGFREGHLSTDQFFILMVYWSLKNEYQTEVTTISLFDAKGEINLEARLLLEETFQPDEKLKQSYGLTEPLLRSEQVDQFFIKMKEAEKSSQQFFLVSDPDLEGKSTVIDTIVKKLSFKIFMCVGHGKNRRSLVASLPMMQEILNVRYRDPVKLIAVINSVSAEYIKQCGLNGTRPVSLPFPGLHLPITADSKPSPKNNHFVNHDGCYHAALASAVPNKERQALIAIADLLDRFQNEVRFESIKEFIQDLAMAFSDMEASEYRLEFQRKDFSSECLFWLQIQSYFASVVSRREDQQITLFKELVKTEFNSTFFEHLFHEREYFEKLGINFQSLVFLATKEVEPILKDIDMEVNQDNIALIADSLKGKNMIIDGYFAYLKFLGESIL